MQKLDDSENNITSNSISFEIELYLHGAWRFSFIDAEKLEDLQFGSFDLELYGKTWRILKIIIENDIITEKQVVEKIEILPVYYEAEQKKRQNIDDTSVRGTHA